MGDQIPKSPWVWKNGEFIPWESATLHVMAHVVHYGSSVFEGIRCYATPDGPAVFRLDAHLRRFLDSAKVYRMDVPYDLEALMEACGALIRKNGLNECYLRPIALRGVGALGLNPFASTIETYLLCWSWGAYLGAEALEKGVDVCVSSWNRPAPNTFPTLAKAGGNYLNAQLMKMEALVNGYTEAIAVGTDGLVSEGSGENIFLVRNGTLYTPAIDGAMLSGITRDSVLVLARDMGIPVREEAIPREALYMADELFFTGTAAEVTPIRSVDRIPVGNGRVGPVTKALQDRLLGVARGELEDKWGWRWLVPGDIAERVAVA